MWVSPMVFGREGMGFGDVKLAAMMGAFLGLSVVLVAVFLGVVAGGVTAIVLLLSGLRRLGEYLPFGTFLALGGVLAVLWGRPLLAWYLG
jgi:leader peptidase (prepilin peptidase)/N-methyltransferase